MSETPKTMQAGFFVGDGTIELRRVAVPKPGRDEVLLRVLACGVCGTDNHILEGHITEAVAPPVVLGHEIAARVDLVGDGVEGIEPGQFCAVDPVIGCGICARCRSGSPNLCADPAIIGYKLNGGFAQFLVAPAGKIIPLSERVGQAGGVLCETLACVVNGYDRLGLGAGASALVLGAGTVGLLWAQMLSHSPTSVVLQSEIVPYRRGKAERLGADVVIDPEAEDLIERVLFELPEGVDFIIDATGEPRAIEQTMPLLAAGGTFMIFGVCPADSSVSFNPFELYNKQARILASKMPPGTLDRAARLIEAGKIACDEIVTEIRPLSRLSESVKGFNDHRDTHVKVAIDPWP